MKNKSKIVFYVLIMAFIVVAITLIGTFIMDKQSSSNKFAVMSTTDIHGKIWDTNLQTNEKEPNNMLAVSSAVNEIRKNFGDKTVLFDNGDLYQGTILSSIDIPQKLTDYESSVIPGSLCLNHIKYDGYTLGNHEFNYSASNMDKCHSYLEGNCNLVCANVYYPGNNQRVFKPYMTKEIDVDGQKIKIGIIGLANTDTPRWDYPSNYNNWIFHAKENVNADIGYEIKKVQNEMEANGDTCDFTIVAYHGGFFAEGATSASDLENFESKLEAKVNDPITMYKNSESQGYKAIRESSNIDMFILGHDHMDSYSNHQYKNAEGKDTLVVNGAKKDLTYSVFELQKDNSTGKLKIALSESKNINLSNYSSDSILKGKIQPYVDSLNRLYKNIACEISENWNFKNTAEEYYTQQTDLADLISRAQVWYVRNLRQQKFANNKEVNEDIRKWLGQDTNLTFDENEPIDVDVSLTTVSVTAIPDGDNILTYKEIASLYPFDNTIDYIPIKGSDIKNILEYNASERYKVDIDNNGNKKITVFNDKYTCPVFWGINFVYDMTKPAGNRVIIDGFSNGKKFDPNKTYCIALNNYFRGNFANPVLKELSYDKSSLDTNVLPTNKRVREVLLDYVLHFYKNGQTVYPTSNIENNQEKPSHWSFIY